MKFSQRTKSLLVICLIAFTSIAGGIAGNWLFIYFLAKYYQMPGGAYPSSPSSTVIIRNSDKNRQVETALTEAVPLANRSLVGIFKTAALYIPQSKIGQGLVITNDGWVVTTALLPTAKSDWQNYSVVASDKKNYEIDNVVRANSDITFIHLKKVNNLPAPDFIAHRDIQVGQSVLGLEWEGTVESGLVINEPVVVRSSELLLDPLSISNIATDNLFLFDISGRIIGITHEGKAFSFDTIKSMLTKLSLRNTIAYPRLGVYYLNLASLPVESGQGALLTALDKQPAVQAGSPAEKIGLKAGDIITAVNDSILDDSSDLAILLQEYNPGETINLTVMRGKEMRRVLVTLDSAQK